MRERRAGPMGWFALAFLLLAGCTSDRRDPATLVRDGDLIFHTSRSSQSVAIQRATGSRYSHMGIVIHRGGRPYVLEAISTVQYTPLKRWIARGERSRYVVMRLKNHGRALSPEDASRLRATAAQFVGKPYDLTFEWSDSRIYCSELVWKLYERALGIEIGRLQKLGEFNLRDPLVRQKLQERYGSKIPRDEPVIAPDAMFKAPGLVKILEG